MGAHLKIACVAIVRNEERHIAEWLAYQFAIGFDTVLLFDNASTDRTPAIARAFAPQFDVRVHDWPNRTPKYQLWAYEHAARRHDAEFDFLAFFDTDEFLVLAPELDLKTLLAQRPEPAIAIPWAIFGSSGHQDFPPGLVIEAFTRRSDEQFPPNKHFKTILRPAAMRACLSPHSFDCAAPYVDLFGHAFPEAFTGYGAAPPVYRGAKLHHYFTRSRAHWEQKLRRGYPDTVRQDAEFAAHDRNEVEDASAVREVPAVLDILNRVRPRYRYAICACARWEDRYVVEWLTYYRAIGYEHVFLYCNDDDPTGFYARVLPFIQLGFVTFRHHPLQGQQTEMYGHFLRHFLCLSEWISFLDLDEYLRLPAGQTIGDFMAGFPPEVDSVLFHWIFFGPNGHKTPPDGLVLAHYTRREPKIHSLTKQVSRTRLISGEKLHDEKIGNGYWHGIADHVDAKVNVVNVLGEDMTAYHLGTDSDRTEFVNHPGRKDRLLATAIIHHYAFRSEAAFKERVARGVKGNFISQTIWEALAEGPHFESHVRNLNAVEDRSLADFWSGLHHQAWSKTLTSETAGRLPLSRHKPAVQSSVYYDEATGHISTPADGAVNGRIDGTRKFHTALEDKPWWQVDLCAMRTISEIHVYNTIDHTAERCRNIRISASIDGTAWATLAEKADDEIVGGVTTAPFIWEGPGTAWARYVRVTLLSRSFLHLDQVEVFGK